MATIFSAVLSKVDMRQVSFRLKLWLVGMVLLLSLLAPVSCLHHRHTMPPFPLSVFGDRTVFDMVQAHEHVRLFTLTGESELRYFGPDRRRILRYPIKEGPVTYDKTVMEDFCSMLTKEESYDIEASLGVGFPHWDYMLTMTNAYHRVDVLVWARPYIVAYLCDGKKVGLSWLGPSSDEFKSLVPRLLPGTEHLEWELSIDGVVTSQERP